MLQGVSPFAVRDLEAGTVVDFVTEQERIIQIWNSNCGLANLKILARRTLNITVKYNLRECKRPKSISN